MTLEKRIERIAHHIVEVLVGHLSKGTIEVEHARNAARYYVDKIQIAGEHTELTKHMEAMIIKIPEMHIVVRSDKMLMARDKEKRHVRNV